jgi:hypothetical protein
MGIFAAVRNKIRPHAVSFKVTPKGAGVVEVFPARLLTPYVSVSLISSAAALWGERAARGAPGYVFLCLLAALTYAAATILVPLLHAHEAAAAADVPLMVAVRSTIRGPLILAIGVMTCAIAATALFPGYVVHAFRW